MSDDFSLLCTGDLHLGRHPTRIPQAYDGPTGSPRAIWQATVQEALERHVDAVIVTGDVIDRESRYLEAYGAFEAGATQLDEAGIPLIVVSGNHDFDALPSLSDSLGLEWMQLLGHGGEWNRFTLERDGEALAHLDGWSFPAEHVHESPLATYEDRDETSSPVIGVVHGDLDDAQSDYAPVTADELRSTSSAAWLLGHIHAPGIRHESDPLILYPGSPQPLDPGEPGQHGPWYVHWDGTEFECNQLPLASVRYERVEVDVSDAAGVHDIPPLFHDRIRDRLDESASSSSLELLLARVVLSGRTNVHTELVEKRSTIEEQLALKEGTLDILVERVHVDTRPAVDLAELADGDSPVAQLATLLLELEDGGIDQTPELSGDVIDALEETYHASAYDLLRREGWTVPPDEVAATKILEGQARLLLESLLEQKEVEVT